MNNYDIKGDENSFLQTVISYGIVIRASFEDVQSIKKVLTRYPNIKIVYQKSSVEKLRIVEGDGA